MNAKPWWYRRVRRPAATRLLVAGAAGAGVLLNLAASTPVFGSAVIGGAVVVLTALALAVAASVVLGRLICATAAPVSRRVLAIGAHPDDVELACGGTLAKLADAGQEVHVLVMSNGRRGGDASVRHAEALRGGEFMGATSIEVLDLPDTQLVTAANEMVAAIEAAASRYNPDIILTHSGHDHHQDHQAVHEATLRAARRHSSILCFESPSATRGFDPSVFIDIADHVEVKVKAVAEHKDQSGKPYMTPDRVRSVAAFRGTQARRQMAEGFEAVRLLGSGADL